MPTRQIDHIVYSVPDLDTACDELETQLGVRPVFGGRHLTQGTQNALLNLGQGIYLEILATDPENTQIAPPRWMGIDLITAPRITRWALKSDDLERDQKVLQPYHPQMGRIEGGQRQTSTGALLEWELIMPLPEPEIELVPFMVNWTHSAAHPTDSLPADCRLTGLQLAHPEPDRMQETLIKLGWPDPLKHEQVPGIQIDIQGPAGQIRLR
ncbi:MAG: VOC family protein [Bacteroidota bacterium]